MRSRSPAVTGRRLRYPYTDREIISIPQARVLRDPVLADQLLRLCSGLSLFEHPDDLFFGKSLRSYRPLPCRRTLLLSGTIRGGHLILAQGRWLGDGDAFARRADAGRDRHGGHDAASREFHGGRSYTWSSERPSRVAMRSRRSPQHAQWSRSRTSWQTAALFRENSNAARRPDWLDLIPIWAVWKFWPLQEDYCTVVIPDNTNIPGPAIG